MTPKPDRQAILKFVKFYSTELNISFNYQRYPEEDPSTPPNARIEAIFYAEDIEIHIEHTSIDLIVSGAKNKRALDPAFTAIEQSLEEAAIPLNQGLHLTIPLDAAKNISLVKKSIPELINNLTRYVEETASSDWDRYPRKPDIISVNNINFSIKPDHLKSGKILLAWMVSDRHFLKENEVEHRYEDLIRSKLDKLANSVATAKGSAISILLVETNDVAAESFHAFAGTFARILNRHASSCTEVWGVHGDSTPTLVWCRELDAGVNRGAYSEDPLHRTFLEIEIDRASRWKSLRNIDKQE